jgi:hypothetical protein
MGRNSVEATKASLMRAVLARRAALPGLLDFFLPVAAGFADFLAGVLAFFVAVAVDPFAGVDEFEELDELLEL